MNWKKIGISVLVSAVIFGLSAFVTFNLLVDRFTLEMPDLLGRNLEEVGEIIGKMALTATVADEVFDRDIPAGHVVEQSIPPGEIVKGQTMVKVVLSKGAEVRLIPSALGMKLEDANEILKENELAVDRVIKVHTRRVSEGVVMAQYPEPDAWSGQAMTLIVSDGPHEVIYYNPYFLGMEKMDALMLARELGLSVRVSELSSSNTISYQAPGPGAEINRGDVLVLRVGG